ncbi:DUF1934 domain-containing protein [Carnobacterium gallinarum]|uniref:DUF1934 domain-containing protein n=1 Tax=Carnobacterium gallinarum TaxID=2749 RepID=UPI000550850B|nr:DUF1934 domain-containing protein [Carnobacterium gallinarum]
MDLKAGTDVKIHLTTQVSQYGTPEQHVFDVMGQMVQMGSGLYLRYIEIEEGQEIPVTIKVEADGTLTLIRAGATRTRLRFGMGERYVTNYTTPQGVIALETVTHKMQVSLKEKPFSGEIDINYDLYLGEEKLGEYKLQLLFTA